MKQRNVVSKVYLGDIDRQRQYIDIQGLMDVSRLILLNQFNVKKLAKSFSNFYPDYQY